MQDDNPGSQPTPDNEISFNKIPFYSEMYGYDRLLPIRVDKANRNRESTASVVHSLTAPQESGFYWFLK